MSNNTTTGSVGNPLDQALASLGVGLDAGAGTRCPPGSLKLDCVETYKIDAQVYARQVW